MFDDPKKELERLQEQLLKDEEWFEKELDSAKRMIGQMPEKKTRRTAAPQASQPVKAAAKPAPRATQVIQPVPEKEAEAMPVRNYANGYGMAEKKETPQPKKKGIKGLLILAGLELLGILGVVVYWILMLL